jgi:hypothetical protein
MPLETREDYERLNEHLWELDPVAKAFADEKGYDYGPPLTNGLYPRLGLFRIKNGISQNILFEMNLSDREERFDQYFPAIPYSVCAGSWIDDESTRVRHHGPYAAVRRIPFSALLQSMRQFLEFFHAHNETITSEIVNACHVKTPIHGHPLIGKVLYLD